VAQIWLSYNEVRKITTLTSKRIDSYQWFCSSSSSSRSFKSYCWKDSSDARRSDISCYGCNSMHWIEINSNMLLGFWQYRPFCLWVANINNNEDENETDDESLFATTLIPLRLISEHKVVLWNKKLSITSILSIQLRYVKESKDVTLQQKQAIENEIDKLQPFVLVSGSYRIIIHFSLYFTLIDGKVLNVITNTHSMQSCPICHATPKNFNNLSNINSGIFISNSEFLRCGISPLHALDF